MKTIGIIGGLSAAASGQYYQIINKLVNERLGSSHNALSLMYSFDLFEFYPLFNEGRWEETGDRLLEGARRLEAGGADFIIIACNTVHMGVPYMEDKLKIPLIHIVDPVGEKSVELGIKKVGLLATRITMETGFYGDRLKEKYGIETVIPDLEDRIMVQRIISDELVYEQYSEESHKKLVQVMERLAEKGAEGIVLGCTELPLAITEKDSKLPVLDGNMIHIEAAVDYALITPHS